MGILAKITTGKDLESQEGLVLSEEHGKGGQQLVRVCKAEG